MNGNRIVAWETRDEKLFIDCLGGVCTKVGRLELLRRYQRAIEFRVEWGQMEAAHVEWYLNAAIARETELVSV